MLMPFVLSCKTGTVVNSGDWLARLPPGAQQYQDSSGIYGVARFALKAGTQGSHSQGSVQAG